MVNVADKAMQYLKGLFQADKKNWKPVNDQIAFDVDKLLGGHGDSGLYIASLPVFMRLSERRQGVLINIAYNTLRWGGDWDRDFDTRDQTFHDLPHFEIVV